MKMKTRIMVWTSGQCTEIGCAWAGGYEQGMPLTLLKPDECLDILLATAKISEQGQASLNSYALKKEPFYCEPITV